MAQASGDSDAGSAEGGPLPHSAAPTNHPCLNCGTLLLGPHCHQCGQGAHVHRTLGAFIHDLLHGVLHFEGRIWRTLPLLAWHPGTLTRRYIDGQRVRYVSPIALFLFVVFLTFALFSAIGSPVVVAPNTNADGALNEAQNDAQQRIAQLTREQEAARRAGRSSATIDRRLAEAREEGALLAKVRGGDVSAVASTELGGPAGWVVEQGVAAWRKAKQNPGLLIYKLQTNAYKYSWLLIPLSVPFLWLLFPFNRRFGIYDHTVFVTYSLSFVMLLIGFASLGGFWNLTALAVLPVLYVPFHMYRQLRGTYALGRAGALWRTGALLLFAACALALFVSGLFALAAG